MILFLAVSIAAMLLIIGLCMLARSAKLEKKDRPVQVRSVFATIVFAVVCVVFYVQILTLIDMFFSIPGVRGFLMYIMPPYFSAAGFYWLVTLALGIFVSFAYCIYIHMIKLLWLIPVASKDTEPRNPISKLFNKISGLFYYTDVRPYVLRFFTENVKRWIKHMRTAFGLFLIVQAVLIPVYIHFGFSILSETLLSQIVKSLFMLALLAYFILDQVFIWLDGLEADVKRGVETESVYLEHLGDYSGFISLFEGMFGGDALISYYVNNESNEYASISTGPDREQLNRSKYPELLTAVCNSVKNSICSLSKNYIDALSDLINGESVVVFDSYYGEFSLYYLSYMQINLFNRRKALIIVDNDDQVRQIIEQYRQIFSRINKVNHIWRFCSLDNMPTYYDDADILVCTEEQLIHDNIAVKYPEFFEKIHDVMIADTYGILCRDKAFVLRLVNALRSQHAQFMFYADENNSDVRKDLKELFSFPEINLYSNFNDAKGSCVMMWRGESYYKTQNTIVDNLYYDFGIGFTLALYGGQYYVPEINIFADTDVPVRTYESIINDSGKELLSGVFHTTESIRVESFVHINPIKAFHRRDLAFDIFYDNCNNIINTARLALTNSGELTSIIHIISRPYMLRDYFAYNINRLSYNTSATQKLAPICFSDLKAPSVALLICLRERGMTCEDIISYMNGFGMQSNNVEEILVSALKNALGAEADKTDVYSSFSFGKRKVAVFANGEYRYTRIVRLTNEGIYDRVKAVSENNIKVTGEHREILPYDRGTVYNRFLPGQTWSFSSRRYIINSITNGVLNVSLEETVDYERSYAACYRLDIANADAQPYQSWSDDSVSCKMYRADVTRSTTGYLAFINGLDFGYEERNTSLIPLDNAIEEKKRVSVLTLSISRSFKDRSNRSAALFTILFRGLFETLLPYNHQDILVAAPVSMSDFSNIDFYSENENGLRRDPIPSDWLEDDDYEIPLSKTLMELFPQIEGELVEKNSEDEIHIYMIEYSETDSSVLETIMSDINRLLSILRSYMEWYVTHPEMPHAYLKLGYKRIPGVLDTSTVYSCLQSIAAETNVRDERRLKGQLTIADPANAEYCSFCGKLLKVSKWRFSDDRYMCEDCYKNRTTERMEIEKLLKQGYTTLESTYGIEVPKDIKIKFKSADSIRAAYGDRPVSGRILGLYVPRRREIWIERGGPAACVLSTIIHELTHAWQYANINADAIDLKYIEGHSVYTEIECLNAIGESNYAEYNKKCVMMHKDVYSDGLKYWYAHLSTETDKNIFHHMLKL